jgi:hypothetical protein
MVIIEFTMRSCDRGVNAIMFGRRFENVCSLLAVGQSLGVTVYVDVTLNGNGGACAAAIGTFHCGGRRRTGGGHHTHPTGGMEAMTASRTTDMVIMQEFFSANAARVARALIECKQ